MDHLAAINQDILLETYFLQFYAHFFNICSKLYSVHKCLCIYFKLLFPHMEHEPPRLLLEYSCFSLILNVCSMVSWQYQFCILLVMKLGC